MKTKPKNNAVATPDANAGNGEISREDIAFAAYCLWEQEGRPEGHDQEHWFRAEGLLREAQKNHPRP